MLSDNHRVGEEVRDMPSQSAASTPGTFTPSLRHRTNTRPSARMRALVNRLSRIGCLYAFGGRYFSAHGVDSVRKKVLNTSASAPCVSNFKALGDAGKASSFVIRVAAVKGAGNLCIGWIGFVCGWGFVDG